MTGYWGAEAFYFSGGPNGEGTRYTMPQPSGVSFTMPRTENNHATIDTIHQQMRGLHPEYISALADQWQNAFTLLSSIRQQLLDQSNALYHEHWKSAEAKDAFMKAGPGKTLAYLDEWMDAMQNNVNALRALVTISIKARQDMDNLWTEFQNKLDEAKYADGWTRFGQGFLQGVTLGIYDADAGIRGSESEAVQEVQKEYNGKAQDLAYRVAEEHFDTFTKVSGGHGPPFLPMDAVLNQVGHPSWTGPSLPPGPPPPTFNQPNITPPTVAPPVVVPTNPQQLQEQVLAALKKPTTPEVTPPETPAVGGVPVPGALPVLPVAAAGPVPTAVPTAVPGGGTAPPTGVRAPGSPSLPPPPPRAGEGGLKKGVLRGKGIGRGLPPGMQPPPGKTLGRKPGAPSDPETERTLGTSETEDAFGRPPTSTAPPVLKSQRGSRSRPGSKEELNPNPRRTGSADTPPPGQPETTAPVLNRPATSPTRSNPTVPGRPARRDESSRPAGPDRAQPPGTEWLGTDAAREDAAAPILDAPAPPVRGGVSRLEEVPTQLRGRATTATGRSATADAPRGTVAPELASRRTVSGTPTPALGDVEEGQKIVTDEEAFSVETPGGGVLGQAREDKSYRAEPPTVLGGN